MTESELQRQIRLLHEEYARGLNARFEEMSATLGRIDLNDIGKTGLKELFRQIHSLSGSAGAFGFVMLNRTARLLESRIREHIERRTTLSAETVQTLREDLERLRFLAGEGPDEQTSEHKLHVATTASRPIGSQTLSIYAVEDDPDMGKEIVDQLQALGFQVRLFTDAYSAHRALTVAQPDAMLIDIVLAGNSLGGPELVKTVRNAGAEDVPIIFFSSRGDWEARLAAVQAGGQAYLTKPVDYPQLRDQLHTLAKRKRHKPFRVLILDDTVALAQHYTLVLSEAGMQVETLNQSNRILKVFAHFKPELVLLDLYIPVVSGIEVARVIHQHQDLLDIPIVFLSSEQDRDTQLLILRQGDDFLQKPISDTHLVAAVKSRVKRARTLGALMYRDRLTGLLNKSTLQFRLEDEIGRARRLNRPLSFVMLDLDRFKQINDCYGHAIGDRILKSLSQLLTECLRKTDLVGRHDGEKFGIILPDTDALSAARIVRGMRGHFATLTFTANGEDFHCFFSAGVAEAKGGEDSSRLCARTDEALCRAKRYRRDHVAVSGIQE